MVYEMDVAGLLNSMPDEELIETCKRLQRSIEDMSLLCNEFEQEQEMLMREQDRLHSRIEKVFARGANKKQEELGIISSFLNQVDKTLEVSNIFKAKAQRQAAKKKTHPVRLGQVESPEDDEQESGPFSDASLQKSWGCDVILGALRQDAKSTELVIMERWVREALCAESVAEADSVDMWMAKAQLVSACVAQDDLDSMRPVHVTASSRTSLMLGQSVPPIAEVSDDAEFGESDIDEDVNERESAPKSVSREVTRVSSRQHEVDRRASLADNFNRLSAFVADLAGGGNSTNNDTEVFSLTVVLRRNTTEEKWGLGWREEDMKSTGSRVFKFAVEDSIASNWNKDKMDDGHPEQCMQLMDRLCSVNGKTSPAEIKSEMNGLEVVLEFHRIVPKAAHETGAVAPPDSDASDSTRATTSVGVDANAEATIKAPRSPARQKPSFSKAFSAYLEGQGVPIHAPASSSDAKASSEAPSESRPDNDEVLEVQARSKESRRVVDMDIMEGIDEVSVPRPVLELPHSVIVQVLSLSAGCVRLSWSFDWSAAPDELRDEPWVARGFEVYEGEDEKRECTGRRWMSSRPFAKLDLPVGHSYTLKVRALILDTRTCSDSSTALATDAKENRYSDSSLLPSTEPSAALEASWVSQSSSAATVDLRSVLTSPEKRPEQRGGDALGGATPEKAVTRPCLTSKRSTVASGLGSFLAQTPSSPSVKRTTSALNSRMTTSVQPELRNSISSPLSASSSSAVKGDAEIQNPLNLSAPRVVAHTPLSAEDEKREIAERLRIRRGGPLVALDATLSSTRSVSIDEDDGSLQQLASALRTLQNSTNIGENVAEEGRHGLSDRLDPSSPEKNKDSSSDLRFELMVQLADGKAETLNFSSSTDTLELMREFVMRNRLREDLLLQPLNERAEIMVAERRLEDAVDIIDLL